MQPGVVYTTFHFPESGANVITTDSSDWATNCPEYKVTAVQVMPVTQPSEWQRDVQPASTPSSWTCWRPRRMDADDNLIRMANRIGDFFEAMPDHAEALEGIATHLKKFWEPRMRASFWCLSTAMPKA